MDLSTGRRFDKSQQSQVGDLVLGSYLVRRRSANPRSLLTETCDMKVEVRRNLDGHLGRHTTVPDVDLRGLLTAVNCSVDEIGADFDNSSVSETEPKLAAFC